jgi:hypothetical protein
MNELIEAASKFPDLLKEIYGDLAKPGVLQAGKAIGAILGLGNTILLPVHLLNEKARVCLEHNFKKYGEKLKDTAQEQITEVPPEVGVPILEKFSYISNEEISDMYINLLASASTFDTSSKAHPSFVKIIESMSPDEAILLKYLRDKSSSSLPFIEIRLKYKTKNEWNRLDDYVVNDEVTNDLTFKNNVSTYLSNFNSLGLIHIRRDIWMIPIEEHYNPIWEQNKDKFQGLEEKLPDRTLTYEKARADITPLGHLFMIACLS